MRGPRRALVVDADVARAAGPDPKDTPWSEKAKVCHDTLNEIRGVSGYCVLFDGLLFEEWKKHQGDTARRWLAQMVSKRRIIFVSALASSWLEALIQELPAHDQATALKDRHLVILAHDHGDKRLVSGDAKAREKFARISDERLGAVHWVAPSDEVNRWLRDGAPDRPAWTLGS